MTWSEAVQSKGNAELVGRYTWAQELRPKHLLNADEQLGPLFAPRNPYQKSPQGGALLCTEEELRRWRQAVEVYAEAMDQADVELEAARGRAARARRWTFGKWRRAEAAWQQAQERYTDAVRAADTAYAPIRSEIRAGIEAENEMARAEERARQQANRRRAELAARRLWGWASLPDGDSGRPVLYVFRHDVEPVDVPEPAVSVSASGLHLGELQRVLSEQRDRHGGRVVWDGAAIAQTEREFGGVTLHHWWYRTFGEHYIGGPYKPRSSTSQHYYYGGGTATGGFIGGHF
ncbi:hypothetical protein [Streptomyces sp. NPDC007264]|uniref:hypothetical protein n=1 Tax=Streptomyces sp. NPDC007264 TaxID=3364777 RepID=UPI0036DEB25A